jgi:hypothetical protein
MEDFIATFEHAFFRECSVASKMRFMNMFSWHAPRLGWKLLNELGNPNRLNPPRPENPPFLLALNPPILPLLHLPSRS